MTCMNKLMISFSLKLVLDSQRAIYFARNGFVWIQLGVVEHWLWICFLDWLIAWYELVFCQRSILYDENKRIMCECEWFRNWTGSNFIIMYYAGAIIFCWSAIWTYWWDNDSNWCYWLLSINWEMTNCVCGSKRMHKGWTFPKSERFLTLSLG